MNNKTPENPYVGRAALKLESIIKDLNLDFKDKYVLDVGSSTGGFTQIALINGASKVLAVELGTDQMDKVLRLDSRIELHEKTDILDVGFKNNSKVKMESHPDIVLMDLSFVSLKKILPHIHSLIDSDGQVIAMVKPQFEAKPDQLNKGIVKNEKIRRDILKDFENWSKEKFVIVNKADSRVQGSKGNKERFYLLKKISQ